MKKSLFYGLFEFKIWCISSKLYLYLLLPKRLMFQPAFNCLFVWSSLF